MSLALSNFHAYFEHMARYNSYTVVESEGAYPKVVIGTITCENSAPQPVPLPDPKYLALHRAFALVLSASGLGQYFDMILGRQDAINMFSQDDATDNPSHVLYKLLDTMQIHSE
ncbi:hypothetical protein NM688_g6917 [Phlebia brevispora]|uniref:Uncharacterized protein n=1 Tax=Phlebia brevispora TaxID=194682 RepID=A0ACC1SB22_9APHY|nr:hypothetical protein NM688_g6917 [Phlebia brevispora]